MNGSSQLSVVFSFGGAIGGLGAPTTFGGMVLNARGKGGLVGGAMNAAVSGGKRH